MKSEPRRKEKSAAAQNDAVVATGLPEDDWPLERLQSYLSQRVIELYVLKRETADALWRIGCALLVARRFFDHGEWGAWLKSLGIARTTSHEAMHLAKKHKSPAELESLEPAEALRRSGIRKVRKRPEKPNRPKDQRDARALAESDSTVASAQATDEQAQTDEGFVDEHRGDEQNDDTWSSADLDGLGGMDVSEGDEALVAAEQLIAWAAHLHQLASDRAIQSGDRDELLEGLDVAADWLVQVRELLADTDGGGAPTNKELAGIV